MPATAWKLCRRAAGGWSGANNITAKDSVNANWAMSAGTFTAVLVGDDFGFVDADVDPTATINGIEFRIRASRWPYVVTVQAARLRKTVGVNVGTNRANTLPTIANTLTDYTIGGAADTFDVAITPAELKAAGFGFAWQLSNPDGKYSTTAYVDSIECRAHFTPAATSGPPPRLARLTPSLRCSL